MTEESGWNGAVENTRGERRQGKAGTRDRKRHLVLVLLVVLFLLALAIVFTRPVLVRGHNATVDNPCDPTMQVWTLSWDLHALSHNPFNLFNANILYPNPHTLAYSDHQIVNAVLSIPFMALTRNPVQSTNYMLIFNFFLCSLGAYLLTVHLTGNRIAGLVAGIAFAYAPNRLAHVTHLNLVSAGWIPLTLLFLHRYCEEKRSRDAFLALMFFTIQTLTTWHYGIILSVAVLLFLLVRLISRRRTFTLRWTVALAAAFIAAFVVILPFALPYLAVQKEDPRLKRTINDVDIFSSDVQDFAVAPKENLLWGSITRGIRGDIDKRGGGERAIFPGLLPLVLGMGGIYYLFRRGRGEQRFSLYFYSTLLIVAALLCLGSSLYLFGHRYGIPMPYRLLYYLFPGFKGMRVPPRFSILISLSLAVLAGFAVKGLLSWITSKRGVKVAAFASAALVLVLLLDLMSINLPMAKVPLKDQFPPVYHWLKDRPGESPTVELPLASYNPRTFNINLQWEATWLMFEPLRTYYSTLHWKKIFNGFTSFIPSTYYDGVYACRDFPSQEAMDFFKKMRIRYVVVHGNQVDQATLEEVRDWDRRHSDFNLVTSFGTDYVYELRGP